ncbi:MAG: hypothetical protein WBN76_14190, partial [Azonexus sp.]
AGGHVEADADGQHQVENDEPDQHLAPPGGKKLKMRKLYVTGGAGDGIPLRTSVFGMLRDAGRQTSMPAVPKGPAPRVFLPAGCGRPPKMGKIRRPQPGRKQNLHACHLS